MQSNGDTRRRPRVIFLSGVLLGVSFSFLFAVVNHYGPYLRLKEKHYLKGMGTIIEQEKENISASGVLLSNDSQELCKKKYLLLTTQKSGSTWFCSVLRQQNGISCGGKPSHLKIPASELLIKYSHITSRGGIANVTWQQYQNDLDNAFAEVCEYNPATSIGFKIMYDQIPPQFITNKKLSSYFEDNGVNIIHLVREAKILVLASQHDVSERGFHHTTNSSMVRETSSLNWNERYIDVMIKMEKTSVEWQHKIHDMTPFVQNYYVAYENILRQEKRKHLVGQIAAFVSGSFDPEVEKAEGTLLKQSNSSCSSRITNYTRFRAHKKVINSRSAAACDLIENV